VTLVLALIALLVLSVTTAAILTGTAVNHRSALQSAQGKKAFALAEQGLAYAEGRLYTAPQSASVVLYPGSSFEDSDGDGTVTYSGLLCDSTTTPACDPKVWTLYGTGNVGGVTRTVSAQVTIPNVTHTESDTGTTTSTDFTVWKYIYINGSGCTSFSGNVTINVPLYTQGGLCLSGNVKFSGSDLEVGGALSLTGNSAIGSHNSPISKLNVVGACSPSPCDGSHTPIWVNVPGVGHVLSPVLTKPPIDLQGTYASSNPGPATGHDCPAGSSVPSNFFDNNHTLNDSDGTINLFPSGQPYDCVVGSNEIKWDGASKLTVNGSFYFDGNLSITGNQSIVYSGLGSLYFTGTIGVSGNATFCGITNCTTLWDTSHNALILVAGCQNSSGATITSGCVSLSGNNVLQTGIYSVSDYTISGNAVNMGPVIADSASFSGNVNQMIPFTATVPNEPGNTTTTTVTTTTTITTDGNPQAPTNWNG
jgi:Tfp pilus assembly protein PilX